MTLRFPDRCRRSAACVSRCCWRCCCSSSRRRPRAPRRRRAPTTTRRRKRSAPRTPATPTGTAATARACRARVLDRVGVQPIGFSATRYPRIREHYQRAVKAGWPRVLVVNRRGTEARRDRLPRRHTSAPEAIRSSSTSAASRAPRRRWLGYAVQLATCGRPEPRSRPTSRSSRSSSWTPRPAGPPRPSPR